MKLTKIVIAAVLAVAMLSGCSMVEVNPERVIVATVGNDTHITLNRFLQVATTYLDNEYEAPLSVMGKNDYPDITDYVLESMINTEVIRMKIEEEGILLTEEDRTEAEKTLEESLDDLTQQYMPTYQNDQTSDDEAYAKAREEIESLYFTEHYSRENMIDDYILQMSSAALKSKIVKDVTVTDEELEEEFNTRVEESKTRYAETPSDFSKDFSDYNYFYIPEGTTYVKHILIAIPEETRKQITELRNAGNDTEADALYQTELGMLREKADDVLKRALDGEDFDELVASYGEDPGMELEPAKSDGYLMYPGSTDWVEPFYQAALALAADGDITTELVATEFGYHIIQRSSTLTSGPAEDRKTSLRSTLLSERQDALFNEKVTEWKEEIGVKRYTDRIDYQVPIVY